MSRYWALAIGAVVLTERVEVVTQTVRFGLVMVCLLKKQIGLGLPQTQGEGRHITGMEPLAGGVYHKSP